MEDQTITVVRSEKDKNVKLSNDPDVSSFGHDSLNASFSEEHLLSQLKHYLPSQAPLKDFVHHITFHAFQNQDFHPDSNKMTFQYSRHFSVSTIGNAPYADILNQTIRLHIVRHKMKFITVKTMIKWKR